MSSIRLRLPRPLYRARQFFGSLRPRVGEAERGEAAAYLSAELLRLFETMSRRDQRHCLEVTRALRRGARWPDGQSCEDRELLAGALLHDVGKGEVRLWHRAAYVLAEAVSPRLLARLAVAEQPGWRGALARLREHGERGAALAAAAGASEGVARLIRGDASDGRLALLQAADDSC